MTDLKGKLKAESIKMAVICDTLIKCEKKDAPYYYDLLIGCVVKVVESATALKNERK